MSTAILTTKLFLPPPRPKVVSRPRLIERLNAGLHGKLTLISAPAGFGKTTLVGEWLATGERPVAWLSLDEEDSAPTRFLAYLVAALQTLALGKAGGNAATLGAGVLAALQSPQPPPTEVLLTALLNEIAAVPGGFVLVLDDYHLVDSPPVDQALAFLLDHLPPQMHLVITTREDPQLPLARLRARGQMTELRAADLRFTESEAAGFLNQVMALHLAPAQVTALEARTEGWIAGLQLAALSLRGQQDTAQVVKTFAGDNRYVVDYLVEEVLQRQPAPVRNFLLQTAMLARLSGPLCDAVTGQAAGQAQLEALERGNFFVVPLDEKRRWYRYHHLFADVLAAHLRAEQPDLVPVLHGRASVWYEQNGLRADAVRHALAAGDFVRAAELIELAVPAMRRSRQEAIALGWLKALPDELVRARPMLSAAYAWALLSSGEFEGVEARLQDAERWLDTTAAMREPTQTPSAASTGGNSLGAVVVDEAEFRRLPGALAVHRAAHALALGDVAGTVKHARRAIDLLAQDDHLLRGAAAGILGLASWTSGDLEAAHRSYAASLALLQRAGHISDTIGCALALADIRIAQGRLRKAMNTYEWGLQLATEPNAPVLRGAADMHVGMSELYRERDDLSAATQHLLTGKELGEHTGLPQNPYRRRVAMARLREDQGDLTGALDLLDEAERLYVGDFSPNVRPVAASRARVWVAQGRVSEALGWAHAQGLSVEDDCDYLHEFEHITLARVLLARYQRDRAGHGLLEATGFLERLLQAAAEGERTGSVIEILVLLALAYHAQGDISAACPTLQRALALAEPQGYVRLFVDEGPPMTQLLLELAARRFMPEYTSRLLAACGIAQTKNTDPSPLAASPAVHPLIEPLSQRELEVLRLFNTELSGPEIARELVVALSTVRTYTKGIYSKLNVNSRRAAVNRAAELGLL